MKQINISLWVSRQVNSSEVKYNTIQHIDKWKNDGYSGLYVRSNPQIVRSNAMYVYRYATAVRQDPDAIETTMRDMLAKIMLVNV